jgi:hypothetical protein
MKYFLFFLISGHLYSQSMTFDEKTGQAVPKFAGEIKILKGSAHKKSSQGRPTEIKIGTKVYQNESVVTDDKSFVKILIIDDTVINLAPNSELNFEKFDYKTKSERSSLYSVIRGQLSAHVKNKAKSEEDIVFKTPNATLGVRGTELYVNHQNLNNVDISEFSLKSGSAVVKSLLENKQYEVKINQKVIIARNKSNNLKSSDQNDLSPEDLKVIGEEDSFLPYFQASTMNALSPLNQLFDVHSKEQMNPSSSKKKSQDSYDEESSEEGSFNSLKKLNEKLKQNQKYR